MENEQGIKEYKKGEIGEIDLSAHVQNYNDLFSRFWIWRDHWRQVQQVYAPYNGRNLWGIRDPYEDLGPRRDQFRLSTRPFLASRALVDLFSEGLTPEDRPCIAFEFDDESLMENRDVQSWLFKVQNIITRAFERGGFYDQAKVLYFELPTFGNANMCVYNDPVLGAVYKTDTIGEFIFGLGKNNNVCTTYRRKIMNIGQIKEEFGYDNMTDTMKRLFDNKAMNAQWMLVNGMAPAKYFEPNGPGVYGMEYDDFWFVEGECGGGRNGIAGNLGMATGGVSAADMKENNILRAGRTPGKPNLTPRWNPKGGEIYGIGPVMENLNSIKMLQEERKLHLRALNKTINPSRWVPASLRSYNIRSQPGANNYYPDHVKPDAIFQEEALNYNIKDTVEDMAALAQEIDEALYKDVSQAMKQLSERSPDGTAYLASKVWEEAMRKIGPIVSMLKRDFLKPAIDRTFEICLDHGEIPPPPSIVPPGMELKIKYTSLLARSQAMIGDLNAVSGALAINTQMAQLNPKAAMIFDPYQLQSMVNSGYGLNPKLIISQDDFNAKSQQMDQAQQAQQQVEQAEPMANAAQKLSQTQIGGKNALEHLTGAKGGQQ